jgi:peptide methionine sulfoxide reductase msrA/msrB
VKYNILTPEEEKVIEGKGTEAPFSGVYEKYDHKGVYTCKKCGAFLYRSTEKFDAGCGWPSFDRSVPGAVRQVIDADGVRMEIMCERCGAHLGHIFTGEGYTPKNTRHCVNSISMGFIPHDEARTHTENIYFGGGCFWCIESVFKMITGVTSVMSGYAGGETADPTYEQVSSGTTGHAEVVEVSFDPTEISLEMLLRVFFDSHDPTTINRQGDDVGTQYRSTILTENEIQKEIVQKFIKQVDEKNIFDDPIITKVESLRIFYPAENYHQDFFAKNPKAGYCQIVISPKITKIREKFADLIIQ